MRAAARTRVYTAHVQDFDGRVTVDASGRVHVSPQKPDRGRGRRALLLAACGLCVAALAGTGTARAAWQELTHFLTHQRKPEPASANVLSEHEMAAIDGMSSQQQAELLLERSINHYRGANEQIAVRVARWRGAITLDG